MKYLIFIFLIPIISIAQPMVWEPSGIPVEQENRLLPFPWTGGMDDAKLDFVDIDGDGDNDVFIGDETGRLWYYKNIGTNTEPEWQFIADFYDSIDIGIWSCPAFCDIDNDGDYDLFVSGGPSFDIYYYNNIGNNINPIFSLITDSLGGILWCGTCNFSDLDFDNDYDLIVGGPAGYIEYYQNTGTINIYVFTLPETLYDVGTYAVPKLVDLNNDSLQDLISGAENGHIYYFRNDGTPQQYNFTVVTNNLAGDVGSDAAPTLVDIDGDGDLDLFVGTGQAGIYTPFGGIRYFENIGTPEQYNFVLRTDSYFDIDCGWMSVPKLVDIDNDGDMDLLIGYGAGPIAFYRNTGTASQPFFTLEGTQFEGVSGGAKCCPEFVDIDADGDLDLLTGYESGVSGYVKLFENIGTPEEPEYVLINPYLVSYPDNLEIRPAVCDIDNDGDYDLFLGTADNLVFYANTGSANEPRFTWQTNNYQNIGCNNGIPHFYDIDGDGDYDLFMGWASHIKYYENMGTPEIANFDFVTDYWGDIVIHSEHCAAPCFSDIDSDGDADLFIGCEDGGVYYYHNCAADTVFPVIDISINGNDVVLSWAGFAFAQEYHIYYQDTPYFTPVGIPQAIVTPPDTSWVDEGAILQGKRYYRVVVEY